MCRQYDRDRAVITFTFGSNLPVIPVRLSISNSLAKVYADAMEVPPRPILINALVDSGASVTLVKADLIERLRLQEKGSCPIAGVCPDIIEYPNYDAGLAILDGWEAGAKEFFSISDMQIIGAPLSTPGIEMLLGMDVLENFEFTINLRRKTVTLRELADDE